MNDLHAWLSQRHHGLRTFRIFQQKLETLSAVRHGATNGHALRQARAPTKVYLP
jgi:hypothetical protein